ncbi:MAG: TetR/AcrR family transcriptional regulator [Hyphomonadaceae bacterium]
MPRTLSDSEIADFRARLCDVAAALFVQRGPEAVTMRALASELGVSAMTPYRYFRDKDEIFAAIRAKAFNEFADALDKASANVEDPEERSRALSLAYLRFALSRPFFYRMMFDVREGDAQPELLEAAARARQSMVAHMNGLVSGGCDAGYLGNLFWSAIHGVVMLKLSGVLDDSVTPADVSADLFNAILATHQGPAGMVKTPA